MLRDRNPAAKPISYPAVQRRPDVLLCMEVLPQPLESNCQSELPRDPGDMWRAIGEKKVKGSLLLIFNRGRLAEWKHPIEGFFAVRAGNRSRQKL